MLVKPPQDSHRTQFRLSTEPTLMDNMVTYLQVLFIFVIVRLLMVVTEVTFVHIPILDPLLATLVEHMRVWFK